MNIGFTKEDQWIGQPIHPTHIDFYLCDVFWFDISQWKVGDMLKCINKPRISKYNHSALEQTEKYNIMVVFLWKPVHYFSYQQCYFFLVCAFWDTLYCTFSHSWLPNFLFIKVWTTAHYGVHSARSCILQKQMISNKYIHCTNMMYKPPLCVLLSPFLQRTYGKSKKTKDNENI